MSLSARERKALGSIEASLAGSAPELVTLLSAFTRLASDEGMPDRERLRNGPRNVLRRFRVRPPYQLSGPRYRRFQRIALGVWLLATVVMIAVGAVLGTSGPHRICDQPMAMTCANPVNGHRPATPARGTIAPAPWS